jgi:hypothetical protein
MGPLSADLTKLDGADPVYPFAKYDLRVLSVANVAAEHARAVFPAHPMPGAPGRADADGFRRRGSGIALAGFPRVAAG